MEARVIGRDRVGRVRLTDRKGDIQWKRKSLQGELYRTSEVGEFQGQQRVGGRPSLLTRAAIQAAYPLNVGNLRDTGHLTEATPPAAMAELLA